MTKLKKAVLVTTLLTPLLIIAVADRSNAQGNQGIPGVLVAIQAVQNSVTSLANQLRNVSAAPTVLATGFEFKPTGFSAGCNVVNAGTSTVTVKMELMKLDGTV